MVCGERGKVEIGGESRPGRGRHATEMTAVKNSVIMAQYDLFEEHQKEDIDRGGRPFEKHEYGRAVGISVSSNQTKLGKRGKFVCLVHSVLA